MAKTLQRAPPIIRTQVELEAQLQSQDIAHEICATNHKMTVHKIHLMRLPQRHIRELLESSFGSCQYLRYGYWKQPMIDFLQGTISCQSESYASRALRLAHEEEYTEHATPRTRR